LTTSLLLPRSAAAQEPSSELLSQPITLVVALAFAALAPFLFMSLTAFVKISTVLQITRGAIGTQGIPSNTVVMALATALTILAMAPVGSRILDRASPLLEADGPQATSAFVADMVQATREPLRAFLKANASSRERNRFFELARKNYPPDQKNSVGRDDLPIVIPAFVVTELIEAFALGFAIYLPFLIIDLVVANVLLSLGMQMMSPTQIALPFKLLLFVAVDGWGLVSQALVSGYSSG
jgi:type III secretion protein R